MIKLISATVLSVAFCSTCSACWFPFFPAYSAGYPGWNAGPGFGYAGYAPSYGYGQSCGYGAGYAPYSASYAGYSSGFSSGCSTCGQTCGGGCNTCGSTVNYLGGINLGCGSGNCGSINCIPDSNVTNRQPIPETLEGAGNRGNETDRNRSREGDRIYEGDDRRSGSDRGADPDWPRGREPDRDLNDGIGAGDFRGSRDSSPSGDFSGGSGTRNEVPDWRNRDSGGAGSSSSNSGGGMFGEEGRTTPETFNSRRPPMGDPATLGSEGGNEGAGAVDVINRGANKPPISDPLETGGDAAPVENVDGELLAPEPPAPTARRRSNLFFASHSQLRSSHTEVQNRQRLAGGRQGNSRSTKISNNSSRSKAHRWISLPMPVGQARL